MVDVASIQGAIGGLKTAVDIVKTMSNIRDDHLMQAKVAELTSSILSAQSSAIDAKMDQLGLLDRIKDLENELAAFKNWEAEQQRYQLTDFGGQTYAYLLKTECANGEPVHRLCADCFQNKKKSILQFSHNSSGRDHFKCNTCEKQLSFGVYQQETVRREGRSFY